MSKNNYYIYIELNTRHLLLKENKKLISTYPVAIGKPSTPTPSGNFTILTKIKNPGGVLGSRWMQFTRQQHGIHGTNKPWLIGQAVSNGCVRMYNHNVEELYDHVSIGTPVIINNSFQTGNNPGPNLPSQSYFIYTIRKGDSLWKIARGYHVSIASIRSLNNLQGNLIYPGQKLKIPTN